MMCAIWGILTIGQFLQTNCCLILASAQSACSAQWEAKAVFSLLLTGAIRKSSSGRLLYRC